MLKRAVLTSTLLVVVASCKSGPGPDDRLLEPNAEAFAAACEVQCEWRTQMRAVSAEMIRAECDHACDEEWALPLVREGSELVRYAQERVRVIGQWTPPDIVELKGGPKLRLTGLSLAEPPAAGETVIAVGTFTSNDSQPVLENVTTVVAAD